MNSYDPTERPGARFVADVLGTDPDRSSQRHAPASAHAVLARTIAKTARELDDLHRLLTHRARDVIRTLQPFALGQYADLTLSTGILQTAGHDIDLLAARRGAAYEHLVRLVTAYERLPPEQAVEASTGLDRSREHSADREPDFNGDWAIADDRQVEALRAVEKGELRLKQSAFADQDGYLSDGTGVMVPIWPETVERLIADGLLHLDTSTTPAQGQLLSLTPQGRQALHTADDATATPRTTGPGDTAAADRNPRTAAALNRSVPGTQPGPATDAPAPTSPGRTKPPRAR